MNQEEKNKRLEDTIESYHLNFHNFIASIKSGDWEKLPEKEKEEKRKTLNNLIEFYNTNFKDNPKYTETLPSMVGYFVMLK